MSLRDFERVSALLLVAICTAGCAALPVFSPQPHSRAIALSNATALGSVVATSQPDPELSGFRLLPSGDFSLHARLELERRSERSLDLQYYQIEDDQIGRTVLRAVRDAAMRGVRVRVLVDDLYTSGEDELLLAFAATPNAELRLFNPFPSGRGAFLRRFTSSLFDFERVNHRMHNKLFIADGAVAVAGGRNLGDEYFARSAGENFVDLDTIVAGALIPRLQSLFDEYWNSVYVRPVESIARTSLTRTQLQERFEQLTSPSTTPSSPEPAPNDILGHSPLAEDLAQNKLDLDWATAQAFADSPDRVVGKRASYGGAALLDVDSVRYNIVEQIRRAQSEVAIVSPYLIPGADGLQELRVLRRRGVTISLITNSLASTDEPAVYAAYRRYRPEMLDLGVELWELSSTRSRDSLRLGIFSARGGRLHAKSAVIDRRILFVGSMNFDPRSAVQNTELGLLIYSETLARQQLKMLQMLKEQGAYRLRAGPGGLEWVSRARGTESIFHSDPDTSFWDRLFPNLMAPFVPEGLL